MAAEVERIADDTIAFPAVPNVFSFDVESYAMPGYHLVAWDHGEAGSSALFQAAVSDVQVIDALERLGAKPGNALGLDTWDQRDDPTSKTPEKTIQGPPVDVLVRIPGYPEPLTLDQILVDEEGRGLDMRFGGHRRNIDAWHSGCIVCLYSCPASKIGNARYTVRDYTRKPRNFRVRPDVIPWGLDEVTILLRLRKESTSRLRLHRHERRLLEAEAR